MKTTTFFILFALATTVTFAQGPSTQQPQQAAGHVTTAGKTIEQRANEITASMVKHLRLNSEQAKKVGAINLSSMKAAEEAQQKYKNDPRLVVQQMDIISQTRLSQIKDVLTPTQFAQYQQRREEKMGVPKEAQSNPASRQPGTSYQDQY